MTTAIRSSRVATPKGWSVHTHERIEYVDPEVWDALLLPGDALASHRFVSVCEQSGVEQALYRHLVIEREGQVVAVATLSSMRVSLDLLSSGRARAAVRWARGFNPSFLQWPVVMCGLPVSFGGSCVRLRAGGDPAPIVEVIASAAESFASELGAGLIVFKELTGREAEAFGSLSERGYFRAPSLPYCRLAVGWNSFEDYLASLRSGYRRQVHKSLAFAMATGLTIRALDDYTSECATLFELYGQIMDRAEHRLERLNLAFFERLQATFGSNVRALLAEREGRVVTSAILLDTAPVTTFLLAGIDYGRSRACGGYPFLVTEVVADAIRRGARFLDLGQTSYGLKSRLGAAVDPRWLYVKHLGGVPNAVLRALSRALFPTTSLLARRVFRSARGEGDAGSSLRARSGASFPPTQATR